jgi:predicted site-specific integrase-resolvase
MNPDLIGIIEAAKILGITTSVVYYHVTNGNLKPVGKFGNSLILDRTAVEAFKARREARLR